MSLKYERASHAQTCIPSSGPSPLHPLKWALTKEGTHPAVLQASTILSSQARACIAPPPHGRETNAIISGRKQYCHHAFPSLPDLIPNRRPFSRQVARRDNSSNHLPSQWLWVSRRRTSGARLGPDRPKTLQRGLGLRVLKAVPALPPTPQGRTQRGILVD